MGLHEPETFSEQVKAIAGYLYRMVPNMGAETENLFAGLVDWARLLEQEDELIDFDPRDKFIPANHAYYLAGWRDLTDENPEDQQAEEQEDDFDFEARIIRLENEVRFLRTCAGYPTV